MSQLATVFTSLLIALQWIFPQNYYLVVNGARSQKDVRSVYPKHLCQFAVDRSVGVQPSETTKKWETAAYPGLRILRSEYVSSGMSE
jgi:hypothetical protein